MFALKVKLFVLSLMTIFLDIVLCHERVQIKLMHQLDQLHSHVNETITKAAPPLHVASNSLWVIILKAHSNTSTRDTVFFAPLRALLQCTLT